VLYIITSKRIHREISRIQSKDENVSGVQVVAFAYGNDTSVNIHYRGKQCNVDGEEVKIRGGVHTIITAIHWLPGSCNRHSVHSTREPPLVIEMRPQYKNKAKMQRVATSVMRSRCTPPTPSTPPTPPSPRKKKHFANNNAGITDHYAPTDILV